MTKAEEARLKREARMQAELDRVRDMARFEQEIVQKAGGCGPVCGIDEAGRGPLAGPVAAAAVILPDGLILPWLNDSKKVTPKRRQVLFDEIREKALAWAVVMVPPERIDEINILQATYEAMRSAVSRLPVRPGVLVNDAVTIPGMDILQVPVIKGDAKCISIAAASILAKVTRDTYMEEMDKKYPEYGFAGHKGYGTKAHCEAIAACGPCPIHRRSFLGNILGQPESAPDRAETGRRALGTMEEEKAARFLAQQGIRVLERNFRERNGEIDIIGEEEDTLLFIEVKYRNTLAFGSPSEAVTREKQKKISGTALYYLHTHGISDRPVRFDVISITERGIDWIKDAFPFTR